MMTIIIILITVCTFLSSRRIVTAVGLLVITTVRRLLTPVSLTPTINTRHIHTSIQILVRLWDKSPWGDYKCLADATRTAAAATAVYRQSVMRKLFARRTTDNYPWTSYSRPVKMWLRDNSWNSTNIMQQHEQASKISMCKMYINFTNLPIM